MTLIEILRRCGRSFTDLGGAPSSSFAGSGRQTEVEHILHLVLPEGLAETPPVIFGSEAAARDYVEYVQRQREKAGESPLNWHVAKVRSDPGPGERRGAWIVRIDRHGDPVGPVTFSLSHRPADPPEEHDFRSDVEPIREVRDFVGYGRSPMEARKAAEELLSRALEETHDNRPTPEEP